MRAVDRQDVDTAHHLIETFPVPHAELFLDFGAQATAVVIVNFHPKGARASRYGLTYASHPKDTKASTSDPSAKVCCWRPPFPVASLHDV